MLKDRLEEVIGINFNFMFVNFYCDGYDFVVWYSDDEFIFGFELIIVFLIFGDTRNFELRKKFLLVII